MDTVCVQSLEAQAAQAKAAVTVYPCYGRNVRLYNIDAQDMARALERADYGTSLILMMTRVFIHIHTCIHIL